MPRFTTDVKYTVALRGVTPMVLGGTSIGHPPLSLGDGKQREGAYLLVGGGAAPGEIIGSHISTQSHFDIELVYTPQHYCSGTVPRPELSRGCDDPGSAGGVGPVYARDRGRGTARIEFTGRGRE